jgi:hypothetical protein
MTQEQRRAMELALEILEDCRPDMALTERPQYMSD